MQSLDGKKHLSIGLESQSSKDVLCPSTSPIKNAGPSTAAYAMTAA